MKTQSTPISTSKAKNNSSNHIEIFRYRYEELEAFVQKEHNKVIPRAKELGEDLAAMNKPSVEESNDIYTGEIKASYNRILSAAKKELQSGIEVNHINSENKDFTYRLKELTKDRQKLETELRLKERELKKRDNSLVKKAERYKKTRLYLLFLIIVDLILSASALQAMGLPLFASILVGLGIGGVLFYLAEQLPDIIDSRKTVLARWLTVIVAFALCFAAFYILGTFRATMFRASHGDVSHGIEPIYFVVLNLFFTTVACTVSYFQGLRRHECQTLDNWNILNEEVEGLKKNIYAVKADILETREHASSCELSRKYLLLYADDIRNLIQQCFEEALQTFQSTNSIYRSDGLTPKFFGEPAPQLPSFKHEL